MPDGPTAPHLLQRRPYLIAALAGAVAGLGQVPFSLTPLALAALGAAAWIGRARPGWRGAAWTGFAAGTGYFAVTLHWIVEPFMVDPVRHGWMAPFALLFMSIGFALFWALAFGVARHAGGRGAGYALALAAALTLVEWLRSTILSGFPWALWGYVWSEGPAAQLGSVAGPFGLTLLASAAAILPIMGAQVWQRGALFAALWLAPLGLGALIAPDVADPDPHAPLVRLIQPNAPQDKKWDPAHMPIFYDRQLGFTAAAGDPDLIVWPETALPFLLRDGDAGITEIAAAAGAAPVLMGAQRAEGRRYYNTLALVGPSGEVEQRYDKHHLVPFGEYMPFGGIARRVGLRAFTAQEGYGYSPGPGPRLLDLGPAGQVLPLICYEAIFPRDVAAAPSRPDWLLQVTNDAWFGSFSGPQQHLAQARMRTIEQGLPMIRVANTGISAVIDAGGRVLAELPLNETGFLDHRVPPALAPPLYARLGDWPALLAMAVLFALGLGMRRRD